MIPQRVKLSGFLSFKEEQEVRFDEAPVWMLSGANGSGKSSIFDALTYALFGSHRGGTQNAGELINKDSPALSVEFEFRLQNKLFRIKRTLRRGTGGGTTGASQQVFQTTGTGADNWVAVPDTNRKVYFDKWVQEQIGLDYDTFTSSVLLLQGRAEKLLDSKPSGRAEVLAGIVNLERYKKLHELANGRKLEKKGRLDALAHQLEGLSDVSEMEFLSAVTSIEECEDLHDTAVKEIDRLLALEIEVRRWTDALTRLSDAKKKLASAEGLLVEAATIEAAHSRYSELREVLPAVQTIVQVRSQTVESMRKVEKLLREQTDAQQRKAAAEKAHELARRQRSLIVKQRDEDEAALEKTRVRLRALTGYMQTILMVESQTAELAKLHEDLARFADNPDAVLQQAQETRDRLENISCALPGLERCQAERRELAVKILAQKAEAELQKATEKEGVELKARHAATVMELAAAREALTAAEQELTVAATLHNQARQAVQEFATLDNAKMCRACGQPLTQAHHAEEKKKREQIAVEAEGRQAQATAVRQAAEKEHTVKVAADKEETRKLQELREQFIAHSNASKQASADIQRLTDSLKLRYTEMLEPFRSRIAPELPTDWSGTTYPDEAALAELTQEARKLDAAKKAVRDAELALAKVQELRTKRDVITRTLESLRGTLPESDHTAIRQEHVTLQAQETSLANTLRAAKLALEKADREVDQHNHDANNASQQLTEISGKLQTEENNRVHFQETIERAMVGVPAAWRQQVEAAGLVELSDWKDELEALTAARTETRYQQLQAARHGLDAIRTEIAACQASCDAFPEEARRQPEEIRQLLTAAREELTARDANLRAAQRHKDQLAIKREQRSEIASERNRIEAEFNRYRLLAELLGRDRLQRHLVRQAERQIVDHANAVLDRLSGGQLFLQLVGGHDDASQGSDRALDMECTNRVTGGAPINVTFLSGSQRFRVAVSLALAIGQYASRQDRPIESVIIDEGFGCLDRQGRQVMIQELQNLRGHLRCILLVSHQEEFADAFADGYRFELHNGATQISKLQR